MGLGRGTWVKSQLSAYWKAGPGEPELPRCAMGTGLPVSWSYGTALPVLLPLHTLRGGLPGALRGWAFAHQAKSCHLSTSGDDSEAAHSFFQQCLKSGMHPPWTTGLLQVSSSMWPTMDTGLLQVPSNMHPPWTRGCSRRRAVCAHHGHEAAPGAKWYAPTMDTRLLHEKQQKEGGGGRHIRTRNDLHFWQESQCPRSPRIDFLLRDGAQAVGLKLPGNRSKKPQ